MDVNFSVPRQTLRVEVVKLNNCTKLLLCSANIEDKNRSRDKKPFYPETCFVTYIIHKEFTKKSQKNYLR